MEQVSIRFSQSYAAAQITFEKKQHFNVSFWCSVHLRKPSLIISVNFILNDIYLATTETKRVHVLCIMYTHTYIQAHTRQDHHHRSPAREGKKKRKLLFPKSFVCVCVWSV